MNGRGVTASTNCARPTSSMTGVLEGPITPKTSLPAWPWTVFLIVNACPELGHVPRIYSAFVGSCLVYVPVLCAKFGTSLY